MRESGSSPERTSTVSERLRQTAGSGSGAEREFAIGRESEKVGRSEAIASPIASQETDFARIFPACPGRGAPDCCGKIGHDESFFGLSRPFLFN
jgi:hypothetical protein